VSPGGHPIQEEQLREVDVIAREPLKRAKRHGVSAIVVDGLEGGDREQNVVWRTDILTNHSAMIASHKSRTKSSTGWLYSVPNGYSTYIQSMTPRVGGPEEGCVDVHAAIQEVVPSVDQTAKSVSELSNNG